MWVKKNANKLSSCEELQMGYDILDIIHNLLNVDFPAKEYKKRIEKRNVSCKVKILPRVKYKSD